MVSVRIIEVSTADTEFGLEVTKYTNTQNSVEKRDFASLDPEQERIRNEVLFDGITYSYKSGTYRISSDKQFDITEATIALACSQSDVALAVQAKREISRLWDDITKHPYKSLFNSSVSGPKLWDLVQTSREIEHRLQEITNDKSGRPQLIGIHGNRFIQWATFRLIFKNSGEINKFKKDIVRDSTDTSFEITIRTIQNVFPDSYPASLFKNSSKCRDLAMAFLDAIESK